MNRANFSSVWRKKMEDKDTNSGASISNAPDKFNIVLATITSPDDYAALQEKNWRDKRLRGETVSC